MIRKSVWLNESHRFSFWLNFIYLPLFSVYYSNFVPYRLRNGYQCMSAINGNFHKESHNSLA